MKINELHSLAGKGDRAAEEALFRNLSESFRLFVNQRIWNHLDAEEIVQDALVTISVKYKEIDFDISFAAWAYKILHNKILQYYRTKRCHQSKFAQTDDDAVQAAIPPPNLDLKMRLLLCLKKLNLSNRRYARILNLCYHGYSSEEICHKMNVSRNNVYILLSRARSQLSYCLESGDMT